MRGGCQVVGSRSNGSKSRVILGLHTLSLHKLKGYSQGRFMLRVEIAQKDATRGFCHSYRERLL
eukprot:c39497_g1_i1 orf=669-860(+)